MKIFLIPLCLLWLSPLWAQDLSIFNLKEPFYLAGESSEDLTPLMQSRKAEFEFRQKNKEAFIFYRKGRIDEFSYFGFKLDDVRCGKLDFKDFISELQNYLTKNIGVKK